MHEYQVWLVLIVCAIVAAHAYNWGRHSGWEKGHSEGIDEGKRQMREWMRAEGMKRRRPRVRVLSTVVDGDDE
ncbi:MAG: hypothetical protein DMF84_09115 [Acidobacteria bacterium]|nr:MAG: hypothetical protein DMF84_09115 [Acidobacteriota bacterium]